MSTDSNKAKREAAIQYLKDRKIHLLTSGFVPTSSVATDIKKTIHRYEHLQNKDTNVRKLK